MGETQVLEAIKQICDEKGIAVDSIFETIEAALAAAYRKDYGNKMQNIKVEFDRKTTDFKVFDEKEVVEDQPEEVLEEIDESEKKEGPSASSGQEDKKVDPSANSPRPGSTESPRGELGTKAGRDKVDTVDKGTEEVEKDEEEAPKFNPKTQVQISDSKELKKGAKIGDIIKTELEVPGDFGRMAAQTAKQVITQKIREAERETLYNEFKAKEGEILMATVQRREGRVVLIDLGRLTAIMPSEELIDRERYNPGDHVKVYILSVTQTTKGPEIIVSRSHPNIVSKLFELEIPEIASGTVEIKGISREAGARSKVAVFTDQESIDPIGSCIGQRGARVHTIISELKGEKIDIVLYDEDPSVFIKNALSPAKVLEIKINEKEKEALATVAEDQLSLAIGKAGQNVRLAAKLTGWKIDIVSDKGEKITAGGEVKGEVAEEEKEKTDKKSDKKDKKDKKEEKDEEKKESDKKDKKEKKATKKKGDKKEEKKETKKAKDEKKEEKKTKKSNKEKNDEDKKTDEKKK